MTYADRSLTDELLKVQPKHDLDLNTQVLTFINAVEKSLTKKIKCQLINTWNFCFPITAEITCVHTR